MDISHHTLEQLEALAYRLVVQRTNAEKNLAQVEQLIQFKRSQITEEAMIADKGMSEFDKNTSINAS